MSARCWPAHCPRCRSPASSRRAHSDADDAPLPRDPLDPQPPAPSPQRPAPAPSPQRPAPSARLSAVLRADVLRRDVALVSLTGRAPALLVLGLFAVVLQPTMTTVRIWWLVTACAIGLDILLALSPRKLVIRRDLVHQVRLGLSGSTTLWLANPTRRRLRGIVRDAWQPSAGAAGDRHTVTVLGGDRVALQTTLTPTRRGDRRADRVTVRSVGPLGLAARQRSFPVEGVIRALPPLHLSQAPAQPTGDPAPARRSVRGSCSRGRNGVRLPARLRDR